MPSSLAVLLTLTAIVVLLRLDAARNGPTSPALWLPVLWLFFTGAFFPSQWLAVLVGISVDGDGDSNPINAVFFLGMIVLSAAVVARRPFSVSQLISCNLWIALFFAWGLMSVAWSEDPTTAVKRWVKTLGHLSIALVILTDPDPKTALRAVLKRVSILMLPLSVLFIKYLPEYGRSFDPFTGTPMNNGIGQTKNDLGYICMVTGIFSFWMFSVDRKLADGAARRHGQWLALFLLGCAAWLLEAADSVTSMLALAVGVTIVFLLGQSWVSKRYFTILLVTGVTSIALVEGVFDMSGSVLRMLGREPTLTDRTIIWADVLALQNQPLIGYGFESFWMGMRLELLWDKWWWKPNQSHNGYIETYLSLGLIGVALLVGMLASAYRSISRTFDTDLDLARLRMALLAAVVMFNYAEAGFKAVHFMWTVFCIIAMRVPTRQQEGASEPLPDDAVVTNSLPLADNRR